MQQHFDVGTVKGKTVLVVANVLDSFARDVRDHFAIDHCVWAVLFEQWSLATPFASNHDFVCGGERLAAETRVDAAIVSNPKPNVIRQECVQDRIRYAIADLVWVAFGHGFRCEQIVFTYCHSFDLPD